MSNPPDCGPFYHGTIAKLRTGQLLTAGHPSNYHPGFIMNHIYFTSLADGAGLAAQLAALLSGGETAPRVYAIEPSGTYEDDPNVTDKKFPGNPTRSYRSHAPLRVIAEVTDWRRLTPDELETWRNNLARLRQDPQATIIN